MKMAHSKKVADAEEKAEAERKAEEAAAGKQAAKKRKEEQEAEQRAKYFTKHSIIVYIDRFYDQSVHPNCVHYWKFYTLLEKNCTLHYFVRTGIGPLGL